MFEKHFKPDDEDGLGGGTSFTINGWDLPRSFTPETNAAAVERFFQLLNKHEAELAPMVKEYREKLEINWNRLERGETKGKNWPIFSKMERRLNQLQKEAGIVDS